MGGSVAMGPHRTVASVLAVLACFLFQLADSTLLASVQPLKSYKLEAGKSSAYPYYDARLEIARYAALVHETYADAGIGDRAPAPAGCSRRPHPGEPA